MTLELEINAATRAFLPEGALEFATPVYRLELKSPESGESVTVIGQLIPVELDTELGHYYNLAFRLESNEIDTNFIVHGGNRLTWTTYEMACEFILDEERMSEEYSRLFKGSYFRIWLPSDSKDSNPILFWNKGRGKIHQHEKGMGNFLWFRYPESKPSLFEMSNKQFDEWAANIYKDSGSELNFAVSWMKLESIEKDKKAFACDNGTWDDLKQIARMVLKVALGQEESLPETEFLWTFTSQTHPIDVLCRDGSNVRDHNDFLWRWQAALLGYFRPKYFDEWDFTEGIPLCLREYIYGNRNGRIIVSKPSNHEIIEARLVLSNWLKENSIPEP